MSRVLTNEQNYYDIADTIRQMKNVETTYKPREMASALKDIYSNEVEGTLPLSFEANGNFLLDYRIDGASGGVGDRTGNLVDKTKFVYGYRLSNIGTLYTTPSEQNLFAVSEFIEVNSGEQYIISQRDATRGYARRISFYQSKNENSWLSNNDDSDLIFTIPNTATYLKFTTLQNYIDSIMLRRGTSLPTTYEPYGYKVPVVVNGKNLFDETQVPDKSTSTETSNYQIFKQNGKLIVNGMTVSNQVDTEISKTNGVNNQALDFINNNAGNYIFTSSVPGRIMIRYKLNGSDVVRYTFDEYNSSNRVADRIVFRLQQNYQYDNETMNIMFKLNKIQSTNYEPYHEPTTTNIYLDKPIDGRANIPNEYEEVEYIESTSTQYINTGFKLNTNCRIVFDYYLTDLVSFSPFGSYQTQNQIGFTSYTTDNTSRFGTFVTRRLTGNYNHYQINNRTHFEYSKNGLYQNGSLVYSITTNDAVSNYNCFIFARNVDDVATGFGNIRMYYFKIYDNDSLVRNLIPCYRKSDNVAGLYDLVNSTFYTNQGTGNFIVGPIKENESISLSDTNKNIPTIDGTNTLTINTTIQPSNVYVQAPKDSIEATMIANALEEI